MKNTANVKNKSAKTAQQKRLKLRHYVLGIIVIIMITVIIVSGGLSAILRWALNSAIKIPDFVWIIISIVASSVITYLVMKKFIVSPLSKLEDAMGKVSMGDFSVRLETNSRIDEIKRSYDSFNIMVKELRSTELLQSDFVANVSHEFKTPLNAIEGYALCCKGAISDRRSPITFPKFYSAPKNCPNLRKAFCCFPNLKINR